MAFQQDMVSMTAAHPISESVALLKTKLDGKLTAEYTVLEGRAILLCFEKYFVRCSSYIGINILMADEGNGRQSAAVVCFGGGNGLLNSSYGAHEKYGKEAVKILKELGFS